MRCTGACCRSFTLCEGARPITLRRAKVSTDPTVRPFRDLIRLSRFGKDGTFDVFMCKALDADARCTIYADRPDICRTYPTGFACPHCGATSDEESRDGLASAS